MVTQHYRWDFIGLSSYDKPTPETSEKVVDGSTYYEADTSKLYVFYKDTWYEKTATGGGGGGDITVVQTTGDSTTDVMSQNATTSMVFADPVNKTKIQIGNGAVLNPYADYSISIGAQSGTQASGSIALGAGAFAFSRGELNIGTPHLQGYGYNGTNFRIISGVHDPVNAYDASNKQYVDNCMVIKSITNFEYNFNSNDPTNPDPDPEACNSWALWKFPSIAVTFLGYENGLGSDIYIQGGSNPQTIADMTGSAEAATAGFIVVAEINGVVNTAIYGVNGQMGPFFTDPSTGEPV